MALAKRTGADVACLQGTLFDGVGDQTRVSFLLTQPQWTVPKKMDA